MYHFCTTLVTTSKTTYELCFMPDHNGLSDLISKTVRQTALMLSFRTFLITILQIFQNVVFDIYRFRNSKPKNQSGVLFSWSFYGLSTGIHGNAWSSLLPPGMAVAADSNGCLWIDLRPSVVVGLFHLLHYGLCPESCFQLKKKI